MRSPRWTKILRDARVTRGRIAMMVAAIALSLFAVATVTISFAVLDREISVNYLKTNPAVATIETERVDDALVTAAVALPGVADAEARATITARGSPRVGEWFPLRLFVIRDFSALRVGAPAPDKGAWPPAPGSVLLERTALELFGLKIGDRVTIKTPTGAPASVVVSGTAHDSGLAPAWQERTGYAYLSPQTLALLGESTELDELKITLDADKYDAANASKIALAAADWLTASGRIVKEVQVPPLGKHPHQRQMEALLAVLIAFSLLALILSAILVATMVSGLIAREIRQIGVMKAVGADAFQIAQLYIAQVLGISLAALALSLPLSLAASRFLIGTIGTLLNFTIYDYNAPAWTFVIVAVAALAVPLLACAAPISRSVRITVREALGDFGAGKDAYSAARRPRFVRLFARLDRTLTLSIRNAFRRRKRLALTLTLLSAAGAMFVAALSVQQSWNRLLTDSFKTRRYDFELRTQRFQEKETMRKLLADSAGVGSSEAWTGIPAAPTQQSRFYMSRTYPDGGHGSLTLWGIPAGTDLIRFPLIAGRGLSGGAENEVVLNQLARSSFTGLALGGAVELSAGGKRTSWRLVGVVKEIGPAAAYVSEGAFALGFGGAGSANSFRIVADDRGDAARAATMAAIQGKLDGAGIGVSLFIADKEFRNAMSGHIFILIFALVAMAVLMGLVGLLGLGSVTGTNVIERTREFGVMRTIGALPCVIIRNVVAEALFTAVLSLFGALLLSLPLSAFLGSLLGNMAFMTALPFSISLPAVAIWLVVLLVGAPIAAASPAAAAAKLTIRETLAYE
ncbi:MAG: FtsX-like permease family protein [Treponemataceae bacterium]